MACLDPIGEYHGHMSMSLRNTFRALVRPLTRNLGRWPIGICIVWASLFYAAYSFAPKMLLLAEMGRLGAPIVAEVVAVWAPLVAAVVSLAMRRHISEVFGSITMAFLLHHSLYVSDYLGAALAVAGFISLAVNRRWFFERLPNVIK